MSASRLHDNTGIHNRSGVVSYICLLDRQTPVKLHFVLREDDSLHNCCWPLFTFPALGGLGLSA